jgi:hypothetical protein
MSDFTAQDYRQLSEALETHDKHGRNMEDYEMFVGAARRFRDRYQICDNPECRDGWIPDEPGGHDIPDMSMSGCPKCHIRGEIGGRGLIPNQERLEQNGRQFDPTNAGVYWWCAQNMVWDDGVMPRDCTPEDPHPDIGSGVCGWALVLPEVRAFDKEPT